MSELKVIKVKDENHYFKMLFQLMSQGLDYLSVNLKHKGEYGLQRSQRFYQFVSAEMAEKIAENLGLDGTVAYVISSCREACYTSYGPAGYELVKKYLKENGINISDNELWIQYLQYCINVNEILSEKLNKCVRELFDDEKKPTIPEVEVAKFCHRAIEDIKVVERNRQMVPECKNIVLEYSDRTVDFCKENNALVYCVETELLVKKINEPPQTLLPVHKERLWSALNDLTHDEFSKGLIEGVFDAMWMYC